MRNFHFWLCLLLFCVPVHLFAQSLSSEPFTRWYGSVQYGRQTYQLFTPPLFEPSLTNARRVQFSLGYQLNPRWSFQAGWGPANYKIDLTAEGTNKAGQPYSEYRWSDNKSNAFSVAARRSWNILGSQKLQLEAIGGLVLLSRYYQGGTVITDNNVVTENSMTDIHATDWYVVVGPGLSYTFGRHFQATSELLFNRNLRTTNYETKTLSSFSLGMRYRFGYK